MNMPLYTVYGYVDLRQGMKTDVWADNQNEARGISMERFMGTRDLGKVAYQNLPDAEILEGTLTITEICDITPPQRVELEIHPEVLL